MRRLSVFVALMALIGATLAPPVAGQYAPDPDTVLLDHLDGTTQGQAYGSPSYVPSLLSLNDAVDLGLGDYIKYTLPGWYQWTYAYNPAGKEGTVEAWVHPRSYSVALVQLHWNNATTPPPAGYIGSIQLTSDGHLLWTAWSSIGGPAPEGPPTNPTGSSVVPLGEWTHVAVTWGPAGTSLYVNGVLDGFTPGNWYPALNATFYVYLNNWGVYDLGALDELRISRVARSEADIRAYVLETTNAPPTVSAGGPYYVNEGSSVLASANGSDPEGGALTYAWDLDNDGTFETPGQSATFSAAAIDGPSTRTISVQATDPGGLSATATAAVTIANVDPTADALSATTPIDEGGSSTVSLTNPADVSSVDAASLKYSFACDGLDVSLAATYAAASTTNSANCLFNDDGSYTVKGRVYDKDGGKSTYSATVAVDNVAPTLEGITGPVVPVAVNTSTSITLAFTDPAGSLDNPYVVQVDWGDGAGFVPADTLGYAGGSVSHSYAATGVYTVCATVADKDGGVSNELCFEYVIVYDPSAGFVTGGGWIMSPAGAYVADLALEGKATFGFVSKYKKGASVPDGNTEFQFMAGSLNFHSTSYQWLVVNKDGMNAQFKGTGTINGAGSYGFMIWATDKTPDTFRIKIWDAATEVVVYDNGVEQALGGGSIVVHIK